MYSTRRWKISTVTRFVPHLARHVELELPRRVGKIEQRAARRLHRLQLARVDSVQARAQRFLVEGHRAAAFEALLLANFAHLAAAQHDPIFGTRETIDWNTFFHIFDSSSEMTSRVLVCGALAEAFHEAIDFLFGEAGQQTRLARDRETRVDFDFLVVDALLDVIDVFDCACGRGRS